MKRFGYFFLLSLLIIGNVNAQDEELFTPKTSFGIKGGMNALAVKTIINDSEPVYKNSGMYFGAFVNIQTSEAFSIQPEINYAFGEYTSNDNINLLHIPILLKFEMRNGFSGYIGPESVVLLKLDKPRNSQEDQEDRFNKFMFGFTFGIAYNISDNFSIEGRPYFSMSKFLDNNSTNYSRYNTFQVGLAYKF